ncbi:MAG: patatin-like phospholipase family protein [Steroidobacteraceae bacterium]
MITFRPIALVVVLALSSACASWPPLGAPSPDYRGETSGGYRFANIVATRRNDGLLLVVATSGGGARAASFAYGVFRQLNADRVPTPIGMLPLAKRIDVISAVSGSSIPAAYWVLHGDDFFREFPEQFLYRNVDKDLRHLFLSPRNLWRLASHRYARGDMFADYVGARYFDEATFAEFIARKDAPFLIINATDLSTGTRFEFTQDKFDLLCLDLARYPIGRAVAASAALPPLATPVTLLNRNGECSESRPGWIAKALLEGSASGRRYQLAQDLSRYLQPDLYPYLHLADGAFADNLGLRVVIDALARLSPGSGSPVPVDNVAANLAVFVIVNASTRAGVAVARSAQAPGEVATLRLAGSVPVDRLAADTRVDLQNELQRWLVLTGRRNEPGPATRVHIIDVDLRDIVDRDRRESLLLLPTNFNLQRRDIDSLICAGGRLLRGSSEYASTLSELGGAKSQDGVREFCVAARWPES